MEFYKRSSIGRHGDYIVQLGNIATLVGISKIVDGIGIAGREEGTAYRLLAIFQGDTREAYVSYAGKFLKVMGAIIDGVPELCL